MKKILLILLYILQPLLGWAQENEAYAVLTADSVGGKTLTFYYDSNKQQRNGMSIGPFREGGFSSQREWDDNSKEITSVVFDLSFANDTMVTSTALWFYGFENLKIITGDSYLNTSNATNMYGMFWGCSSLASLDLSKFNTGNVTNMGNMFSG
ncbi:MAG: DUF285 domain-containing protein, partial [Prevotella sp.]|nr:DUF285 domain-containing protein [Prevotella sp.]